MTKNNYLDTVGVAGSIPAEPTISDQLLSPLSL